jgi:hypothetical protein
VQSVDCQPSFRWNMSSPLPRSKDKQAEVTGCLTVVSFLAYTLTLKMEVKSSYRTSFDNQWTAQVISLMIDFFRTIQFAAVT